MAGEPGEPRGRAVTLFQASYVLLWVLALVLALASVVLLYLLAQLQTRAGHADTGYGIKLIGRPIPGTSEKDALSGVPMDTRPFDHERHIALVLSPDCSTCRSLMSELKANQSGDIAELPLWLLCMGDFERCQGAVADLRSFPVLVQDVRDEETIDLRLAGFPAALVLDETGTIVDVQHPLSIKDIVTVVETLRQRDGTRALEPAPQDVEAA